MYKILVIATTFPRWRDDTEPAFVFELSKRLLKMGNDITVLAPHAPGALKEEVLEGLKIKRYSYFYPATLQKLFYNGGVIPNLGKYFLARVQLPFALIVQMLMIFGAVISRKYDFIHCHWIITQGFFAGIARRFSGIPLILTAHGGDVFNLKNPLMKMGAVFALKNCDICTANSLETKRGLKKIHGGTGVEVIPMGVDLNMFGENKKDEGLRERLGIKGHFLLAVGRFAEKKGFRYLIDAMPGVLKEFPDTKLLIIGFGPLEDKLKEQTASLGLTDSVLFPGKKIDRELAPYYAESDIFIGPSVEAKSGDREGLGVVFLEAMASGTPVIGSKSGGIEDIIRHGETGFLSEPKDPLDISEKIKTLLRDENLRIQIGENGCRFVKENFSWESIAARFDSLYHSVMEEK